MRLKEIQWKARVDALKSNTVALYLASRHPRVPTVARVLVVMVVAYALSPIDLIPDFIPVIGYLDDLLIVPLGIWIAMRLIPSNVWEECRARAAERAIEMPASRIAAVVIVATWLAASVALICWMASING